MIHKPKIITTQETGLSFSSQEFFKALFDQANDGILIITNDVFSKCNLRALDMLEISHEQILGKHPWDLSITPQCQPDGQDSKEKAEKYLAQGYEGERMVFEWQHITGQGKPFTIEVSLSLISDMAKPSLLCHWRDITQRIKIQQALKESEEKYRRIVEDQTDFIVRYLPDGTRTFVNQSYSDYFHKSKQELIGTSFIPLVAEHDRDRIKKKISSLTPDKPIATEEHLAISPSGELRWHRWIDRAFFDNHGNPTDYQAVGRDIHDQKIASETIRVSEEKFSKAFHATPDTMLITRMADNKIMDANEGFSYNSGFLPKEVIGKTTLEIGLWVNPIQLQRLLEKLEKYGSVRDFSVDIRIKSGDIRHCIASADTIEINKEQCLVTVINDVTESKNNSEALEYQLLHDSLTGLPNRIWLKNKIDKMIGKNIHGRDKFAILLMDLNRFKETNNTFGHDFGDQLIKAIGQRLYKISEESRFHITRTGGDEFAILTVNATSDVDITNTALHILNSFEQSFEIEGQRIQMSASLGIAVYPQNGDSADTLLRCADVALYIAKEEASGYAFYSPEKDRHSHKRLALMSELHTAINENQLCLHYQPIIDIQSKELHGFEALVRWQHPIHGMIPPGHFIPFAEMGESIRPLTYWVLEKAISQCEKWRDTELDVLISVNLSTRNLLDEGCTSKLNNLLQKYNLEPEQIRLEITESAFIQDPNRALKNLEDIHKTGVQLSIDDFGTGYSSMTYLKRMPIQNLKIDMSFVRNMLTNEQDKIIVMSTINLAHNLGLTVTAEGVESEEILLELHNAGCDYSQGFYFSKPEADADILDWVNQFDYNNYIHG